MALEVRARPGRRGPVWGTLGGGAEIALHAARCQASAETYMGLVEVGVGLIPGGGGCKELLLRLKDPRRVFELVGYGEGFNERRGREETRSASPPDRISMNPERLIGDAKELALTLVADYAPGSPRTDIAAGGENAYAMLKTRRVEHAAGWIHQRLRRRGRGQARDRPVRRKADGEQLVSEQYLLDLEREAFLSLCGNPKTQERMQHTLKTGKPLRN